MIVLFWKLVGLDPWSVCPLGVLEKDTEPQNLVSYCTSSLHQQQGSSSSVRSDVVWEPKGVLDQRMEDRLIARQIDEQELVQIARCLLPRLP